MAEDKLEGLREDRAEILYELERATDPKEIGYWESQLKDVDGFIETELDRRGRAAQEQIRKRARPADDSGGGQLF